MSLGLFAISERGFSRPLPAPSGSAIVSAAAVRASSPFVLIQYTRSAPPVQVAKVIAPVQREKLVAGSRYSRAALITKAVIAAANATADADAIDQVFLDSVTVDDFSIQVRGLDNAESVGVQDLASRVFSTLRTDAASVADALGLSFDQGAISDAVSASDAISAFFDYGLTPTDAVTATDALAAVFAWGRPLADAVTLIESFTVGSSSSPTEVLTVADVFVAALARALGDSVTATDSGSGSLNSNDYCDPTYFSQDYVGTVSTFTF